MLAFDDGELVYDEPVVVFRVVEIDQPDDFRADGAVFPAALDGDAVHEQAVEGAVAGNKGRMLRNSDFTKGFVERLGGQFGIQLPQRGA